MQDIRKLFRTMLVTYWPETISNTTSMITQYEFGFSVWFYLSLILYYLAFKSYTKYSTFLFES